MLTKRQEKLLAKEPTRSMSITQLELRCDRAEAAYHAAAEKTPEWHRYQEAIRQKDPQVKEYARRFHCAVAHLDEWWTYEDLTIQLHCALLREGVLEGI